MTDRLSEMAAVADGKEVPPETIRTMLSEAIDLLAQEKEHAASYLQRLISERGAVRNDDLTETARNTIRIKKRELAALHVGRNR